MKQINFIGGVMLPTCKNFLRRSGAIVNRRNAAMLVFSFVFTMPILSHSQIQSVNTGPGLLVDGSTGTNCCSEVYGTGFELGALRSIAHFVHTNYVNVANQRMARISVTLQNATNFCNKICPAWSGSNYQPDILTESRRISPSPAARQGTMGWADGKPRSWGYGLKECQIWQGTNPTKWTQLSTCAEIYFSLGYALGNAWHNFALAAQGVTQCLAHPPVGTTTGKTLGPHSPYSYGMSSLRAAVKRIKDLHEMSIKLETETASNYCVHLWDGRLPILRPLQEVILQPTLYSDAEVVERINKANGYIKGVFWTGFQNLWACPGKPEEEEKKKEKFIATCIFLSKTKTGQEIGRRSINASSKHEMDAMIHQHCTTNDFDVSVQYEGAAATADTAITSPASKLHTATCIFISKSKTGQEIGRREIEAFSKQELDAMVRQQCTTNDFHVKVQYD